MTSKTSIETDDQAYFFDKNTGERFAIQSSVRVNDISHHHMKSEISGKTVLLSEYGIEQRFSKGPVLDRKGIRSLIPRFFKLR